MASPEIIVSKDGIELNSPEEALFYGLCRFHEIPVERVMLSAEVEEGRLWYWPAFRVAVPKILDLHAEVADPQTDSALRPCRAAWRARSAGILAVLYREELDTLREASRPAQFAARLKLICNRRLLDEKTW
jgi:hypothetical protein